MSASDDAPATKADVEAALVRTCHRGRLHRIPKRERDRLVVLALAAKQLERHYPYSELEVNAELEAWLEGVRGETDYVTLRRFLVDFGLIKRDLAGSRYFLNYPKLTEILDPTALAIDSKAMVDALAREEWARRRAWQRAQPDSATDSCSTNSSSIGK